ncbi:uncharacterized protein LOC116254679 [Nymphaea colorata]|uniref:uncharacterized protein LOC116254679 n=1 Tax=Nymphaea colorata TaxID=210225 RepID=UPI00129E5014|nr:uncharacterized protein LOC116254679 [Nymphaea colorata]
MAEGGEWEAPPYGAILVAVVGVAVALPMVLGDPSVVLESIQEMLSPSALLLIPLLLLFLIRFLSSERCAVISDAIAAVSEPNSIHRIGGSPVGVAILLLVLLLVVYFRSLLSGGGDDE